MAPMVAVIRLPQKSGIDVQIELLEQEAADDGADQADREVVEKPAASAAEDQLASQPATRPMMIQ